MVFYIKRKQEKQPDRELANHQTETKTETERQGHRQTETDRQRQTAKQRQKERAYHTDTEIMGGHGHFGAW